MTICKYCGVDIQFIRMEETGRFMPCEKEKVWGKEIDGDTLISDVGELLKPCTPEDLGYEPHWSNCSGSNRARRS